MSDFEIKISEGLAPTAWRVMLYGTAGIGKSTAATKAPDPLFLDLENGLSRIDCKKTQLLTSMEEVMAALRFAYTCPEKTIVIDNVSKLEEFLTAQVIADMRDPKIKVLGDIPWGRGPDFLLMKWVEFFAVLSQLQRKGKNVLLIGHDAVIEHLDPTSDNYHRYAPRLNKKTLPFLTAEVDAVLFAHWEKYVKSKTEGKGRIAVGTGARIVRAIEDPSAIAKNRFGLPETLPLDETLFDKLN